MQPISLDNPPKENLRPGVIRKEDSLINSGIFWLRLMVDSPQRSLISGVRPILGGFKGRVLDVGAGSQFFRRYLPADADYRALELRTKDSEYGWEGKDSRLDLYDGGRFPYDDNSFDCIMCLEVLEHTQDPDGLLREIERVLRPGGTFVFSVPFSHKWHFIPHDYWRFTPSGLKALFSRSCGLELTSLYRRGTDFTVAFHVLTTSILSLIFKESFFWKAVGLLGVPLAFITGVCANISEWLDIGSPENAVGYLGLSRKPIGP